MMDKIKFTELNIRTQKDREITAKFQDKVISRMITAARQEADRLEHHLLEMPLSVILYQWIIIRLKNRPWRLLFPVSIALSILLQGILRNFNVIQFLSLP